MKITELALRDAHQSLLATRMAMEDMVPACEDIDPPVTGRWSAGAAPPSTPASAS
jgi:methylmalonyl-CoA carboxyltransferase 5S subunit